jgi:hypothetical protein
MKSCQGDLRAVENIKSANFSKNVKINIKCVFINFNCQIMTNIIHVDSIIIADILIKTSERTK